MLESSSESLFRARNAQLLELSKTEEMSSQRGEVGSVLQEMEPSTLLLIAGALKSLASQMMQVRQEEDRLHCTELGSCGQSSLRARVCSFAHCEELTDQKEANRGEERRGEERRGRRQRKKVADLGQVAVQVARRVAIPKAR
jgi:hypothetical protein